MMDTTRLIHSFLQHLPQFLKRKLSHRDNHFSQNFHSQFSLFASMTNIHHNHEEDLVFDTDGCLLLMQTTQSNLSLFNVSCDSLVFNEDENLYVKSRNSTKQYNSSIDVHLEIKKMNHRSTMILSDDMHDLHTNTLQRWKGLELLNIYT